MEGACLLIYSDREKKYCQCNNCYILSLSLKTPKNNHKPIKSSMTSNSFFHVFKIKDSFFFLLTDCSTMNIQPIAGEKNLSSYESKYFDKIFGHISSCLMVA